MIRSDLRRFASVLSAVVVLAVMTGSVHAATDWEPTYPPDGTWLITATMTTSAGEVKVPFMDTYASLPYRYGWKGTVICTLALVLNPNSPNRATQTGQGSWTRVQKNVYAFTAWRIQVSTSSGNAVGWVKFWGYIRPDAPDHFKGEINAAFYTLDFKPVPGSLPSLPTEGWRVEVEGQ